MCKCCRAFRPCIRYDRRKRNENRKIKRNALCRGATGTDIKNITHGGAVLKSKIGYEENVAEKLSKNQRQKEKIAELAVNYVEDGDIIALDTGTTMLAFA